MEATTEIKKHAITITCDGYRYVITITLLGRLSVKVYQDKLSDKVMYQGLIPISDEPEKSIEDYIETFVNMPGAKQCK